jgi:hypothetical protein
MKTKIKREFARPILQIANALSESGIPFSLNTSFDGMQICFPWANADMICHSYSYGSNFGKVESMGFPWDKGDVTSMEVNTAIRLVKILYKLRTARPQ